MIIIPAIVFALIAVFLIGLIIGAVLMLVWLVGDFDAAMGQLFGAWYP